MIGTRVTVINNKNNGKTVRYIRSSTIGDTVKTVLNAIDQNTPIGQLPDSYSITVEVLPSKDVINRF